ncbi:MAG: DUF4838 domain-containing protein [Clostridia bacterium]|nr:DUF4838 domain-containing protein [Clostridia bacterium]
MNWKLTQLGDDITVAYAADELHNYLSRMDRTARISRIAARSYDEKNAQALYIGCDAAFTHLLPKVEDPRRDDAVYINVSGGAGIITGTNPRSVLIAVYRYLRALGCAFLRPGKDGDIIPACSPQTTPVYIAEAASYRHRAVCIEGAVSYEHVADMIDFLPKIAMNGYFVQFKKPYEFFERWYQHGTNPTMPAEPMTEAEMDGMYDMLRGEIHKRGLMYHAVGHSWTCEPFGVQGAGWTPITEKAPDSIAPCLAKVNGKREFWGGVPLNTNLCYSNPAVRSAVTSSIVDYCEEHPDVDYLHFWLADGSNNHCECERCKEIPADYYVMMLNELDEKLTAKGIDTKIVFLIYVDLLWEPQHETIRNQDRFVLMFAPITRTYSKSYTFTEEEMNTVTLAPYEKNKLTMPHSVAENVARLRKWQEQFKGDSFDYDYHLVLDNFNDPGSIRSAKILATDMQNLKNLGINGMNSCQAQRVFFPTSLPMLAMAETLWNREAVFADIARSYFTAAFGDDGIKVWRYLAVLSDLFDPEYLRGEKPAIDEEKARSFAKIPGIIADFMPVITRNIARAHIRPTQKKSWEYLLYHAQGSTLFAQALAYYADDMQEDAHAKFEAMIAYYNRIEPEVHPALDVYKLIQNMKRRFL